MMNRKLRISKETGAFNLDFHNFSLIFKVFFFNHFPRRYNLANLKPEAKGYKLFHARGNARKKGCIVNVGPFYDRSKQTLRTLTGAIYFSLAQLLANTHV